MKVTQANYFSKKVCQYYTGSTEIKEFLKCESCALAKLNRKFKEEPSKSMLVSSYIDAAISDELPKFHKKHPEIFLKNGELKADYRMANEVLRQINKDKMFKKYINGEHQVIMTGEIAGVPIKIKIDSFHPNKCIVDLKCMANLDFIWNEETKQKENFIDFYDYVSQGTIYQEIVRQNTGKQLPFIIAVATKEKYSQRVLLQIPQEIMDRKLEFLKQYLPHLQDVKQGKIEPAKCNKCNWCISKQKCKSIWYYDDYFKLR